MADRRPTRVQFPCGHFEGKGSANARTRAREHAAWVQCQRCNVIVLYVQAPVVRQQRRGL